MMHLFVLIVLNVLHIIMLHVCGRRRFLQRFLKFLIILAILIIISFLVSSDRKLTIISNRNNSLPRLYCILLNTQSTHERFIYMSNKTWAKQCDRMGIVKYRKLQETEDGKSTYFQTEMGLKTLCVSMSISFSSSIGNKTIPVQ